MLTEPDQDALRIMSEKTGISKRNIWKILELFYMISESLVYTSKEAFDKWFKLTSQEDDDMEDHLKKLAAYSIHNRLFAKELDSTVSSDEVKAKLKSAIPGSTAEKKGLERYDYLFKKENGKLANSQIEKTIEDSPIIKAIKCKEDAYKICRSATVGSSEYKRAMEIYSEFFIAEDLKEIKTSVEARNVAYHAIRGSLAETVAKRLAAELEHLENLTFDPRSVYDIVGLYELYAS